MANKCRNLHIRLSDAEWGKLQLIAEHEGLTASSWIRRQIAITPVSLADAIANLKDVPAGITMIDLKRETADERE